MDKDKQIEILREATRGLLMALELVHMLVSKTPGIDMNDEQVANLINTTMNHAKVALDATGGRK